MIYGDPRVGCARCTQVFRGQPEQPDSFSGIPVGESVRGLVANAEAATTVLKP